MVVGDDDSTVRGQSEKRRRWEAGDNSAQIRNAEMEKSNRRSPGSGDSSPAVNPRDFGYSGIRKGNALDNKGRPSTRKRKRDRRRYHRTPYFYDDESTPTSMIDGDETRIQGESHVSNIEERRERRLNNNMETHLPQKIERQFGGEERNQRHRKYHSNRPSSSSSPLSLSSPSPRSPPPSVTIDKPMNEIIIAPSQPTSTLVNYRQNVEIQRERDKLLAEYGRLYGRRCAIFERQSRLEYELRAIHSYISILGGGGNVVGKGNRSDGTETLVRHRGILDEGVGVHRDMSIVNKLAVDAMM